MFYLLLSSPPNCQNKGNYDRDWINLVYKGRGNKRKSQRSYLTVLFCVGHCTFPDFGSWTHTCIIAHSSPCSVFFFYLSESVIAIPFLTLCLNVVKIWRWTNSCVKNKVCLIPDTIVLIWSWMVWLFSVVVYVWYYALLQLYRHLNISGICSSAALTPGGQGLKLTLRTWSFPLH